MAPSHLETYRFDAPHETVRPWDKVVVEIVKFRDTSVARVTVQPGWSWTRHAQPVAGKPRCPHFHVKLVHSGRLALAYASGVQRTIGPGEVAVVPPDHDAWAVGNEPVVFYDLTDLVGSA